MLNILSLQIHAFLTQNGRAQISAHPVLSRVMHHRSAAFKHGGCVRGPWTFSVHFCDMGVETHKILLVTLSFTPNDFFLHSRSSGAEQTQLHVISRQLTYNCCDTNGLEPLLVILATSSQTYSTTCLPLSSTALGLSQRRLDSLPLLLLLNLSRKPINKETGTANISRSKERVSRGLGSHRTQCALFLHTEVSASVRVLKTS